MCWLVVFYVPATARSFRDDTPILLSLAKYVKLGKYTVPTGNQTPGRRGSPLRYRCATQADYNVIIYVGVGVDIHTLYLFTEAAAWNHFILYVGLHTPPEKLWRFLCNSFKCL